MFMNSKLPEWIQVDVEKSDRPVSVNSVNLSSWIASLYVVKGKKIKTQNPLKCKSE